MTAVVISNMTTFGSMTNNAVGRLLSLNTTLERLKDAVATASSGYEGTPGTEFEAVSGVPGPTSGGNNFGVQPDPAEAGKQGTDYAYALNQLTAQWATFWTAAQPYIEQLDNGTQGM
jgi:hypothetical protein